MYIMQAKNRFNALNLSIYMIYVTKLKCLKGTFDARRDKSAKILR